MPWLTGNDNAPTSYTCRRVLIPNDFDFLIAVNGALLELTKPENWQQFGTVTPEEAASLAFAMYREYMFSDGCMIGLIVAYGTLFAPPNTLPCDGGQYDRVAYPDLYNLLPPPLIVDADHFLTPDLNGRFVVATGTTYNGLETGGTDAVTLTTDQMPTHSHTTQPHAHGFTGVIPLADAIGAVPEPAVQANPFATTQPATVLVDSAGGGQAHENRPPFIALPYCIVAR